MKLFTCTNCGNRLYFDNISCTRCHAELGYIPDEDRLVALEACEYEDIWVATGESRMHRKCSNYSGLGVCNWLVDADDEEPFCISCRLNRTIPDLDVPGNREHWQIMETEKRQLIYSLIRLGLTVNPRSTHPDGLEFDFLANIATPFNDEKPVVTGHKAGLITINIAEADPVERSRIRHKMNEPYRTILGHLRHESGHFYWDNLIRNCEHSETLLKEFRELFGDERLSYAQAMRDYYQKGAPLDWQQHYVSAYASMHPWEDWAESWAHYLHIVDTLDTAWQFGLRVRPKAGDDESSNVKHNFDPYCETSIDTMIEHWLPLALALNSLNRSMGHEYAYPFVLSQKATIKLGFLHKVILECRGKEEPL